MKDALLILFGAVVGFDLGIGYSWWTLRRARRANRLVDFITTEQQKRLRRNPMVRR